MKVFISWSGSRSRQVGELLCQWLKCVLQSSEPWISTDMDRGAYWFSEISNNLNDSSNGIICLTRENIGNPWILFEAGALAKGLSANRVCTLLIDLEPKDIEDPLAQFNHTSPNATDMFKLVKTLNSRLGEKSLTEPIMKMVFDTYWNYFETTLKKILETIPQSKLPERKNDDIMQEILMSIRTLNKRMAIYENSNSITDKQLYAEANKYSVKLKSRAQMMAIMLNRLDLSSLDLANKDSLRKAVSDIVEETNMADQFTESDYEYVVDQLLKNKGKMSKPLYEITL